MALFEYSIRDSSGTPQKGHLSADTLSSAAQQLRSQGAVILDLHSVDTVPVAVSGTDTTPNSISLLASFHPAWLLPITSFDIEMGIWQLASMLRSGLSILEALETVAAQARRLRATRLWLDIRSRIQRGESFSQALAVHPRAFGPYLLQLARVGEHSGEMDTVLTRAAQHLASQRDIRLMVANAMLYPALTILMAIGVSVYLVLSVIPKVADFLSSGGESLPGITQSLLDLSEWILTHGPHTLLTLAAIIAAFALLRRHPASREALDATALRLPPFGSILRLSGTAIFARGLSLLIESGVSLLDALHVVQHLLTNQRLAHRVQLAKDAIIRGEPLANALAQAPEFLPMLHRMCAVAEKTGTLAETMDEIAAFHERMLVLAIKRVSTAIEPVVIILTGLLVGYVYIAFFMALFSLANAA